MGKEYYFFAASLVMISFDQKPPMTVEEYLKLSKEFLTEENFASMKGFLTGKTDDIKTSSQALQRWIVFDKSLKNEVASFRAKRAHKNPDDHIKGDSFRDYSLQDAINQASRKENLLEAEKDIDNIRWKFLEELSLGHYFDVDFLYIYGLKLKILERYVNIASTRGAEVFNIYKENAAILAGDEAYGKEKKLLQKQN